MSAVGWLLCKALNCSLMRPITATTKNHDHRIPIIDLTDGICHQIKPHGQMPDDPAPKSRNYKGKGENERADDIRGKGRAAASLRFQVPISG